MSIALIIPDRDVRPLQAQLKKHLQDKTAVWIYPDIPHPQKVEMVILWKHPPGCLKAFPNLKLISSLGAGVEHIFQDPTLPAGIPVTRIVDKSMVTSMRNYVIMCVLNIQKNYAFYRSNQQKYSWEKPNPIELPLRIGILGLGKLGAPVAGFLANMDFEVHGYSRHPKEIKGVHCYHDRTIPLLEFVSRINLLICMLPRTNQTDGLLNYHLFHTMPKGSFLINVARGTHLVDTDLLKAMQEGYISAAYLDVFQQEPLPDSHPFWDHPGIFITPHIASITNQEESAHILAENYKRVRSGKMLLFEAKTGQGY